MRRNPRMYDVFISYRSTDLHIAEGLRKRLTSKGFRVWFDKARLNPGCDWHREIEVNCEASRIILPVLTPQWRESEWCLFETYGGEHVIPLLFAGDWAEVAPPPLRAYQFLDLRRPTKPKWDSLLVSIRKHLRRPQPAKIARLALLPYAHNLQFVGRDQMLLDLHERLFRMPATVLTQAPVHAIAGMGGVGKTTLAREYAEKFWRLYQDIMWVRAEGTLLAAEFARLAVELGLIERPSHDPEVDAKQALRELAGQTSRLLILDNADSEVAVQEWIPKSGGCRTVITSRFVGWSPAVTVLDVDVLAPDAARDLLLRRSGLVESEANHRDAGRVADALGYLPLALEQAAAFARKVGIDFDQYLRMYSQSRQELLAQQVLGGTQYPDSVATTWRTTVGRLSPLARSILRLASFLSPDDVPVAMLEHASEHLRQAAEEILAESLSSSGERKQRRSKRSAGSRGIETTPIALRLALGELAEYSMISLRQSGFSTHRLVQAVQADSLDKPVQRKWAERGVRVVNLAFPEPDNPNSLHGGHYGWDSWGRCSELLSNAKICERWVEQWHLVSGEAEHLRSKVQMYESDISYKEDWDRSGGLWE